MKIIANRVTIMIVIFVFLVFSFYNFFSPHIILLCLLFMMFILYVIMQQYKKVVKESLHLKMILDSIPFPIFTVNEKRKLSFINKATKKMFDCNEQMLGHDCFEFNTCICCTKNCALNKKEAIGDNHTYYDRNGKSYMVTTVNVHQEESKEISYIEVIEDISEVMKTKNKLEEKSLELETISENLNGAILITTMEEGFRVIKCNKNYREMTGRDEDQIIGQLAMHWVAKEDVEMLNSKIQQQLCNGDNINIEHLLHRADGSTLWVSLCGKKALLNKQEVGVWILTDISYIKEKELALKVDEERYRIAMQNTEDIIFDYDMNTHIMYHSSKAKEIYGVREYVENMPDALLNDGTILMESREVYLALFKRLYSGVKKSSCDLKTKTSNGQIIWNRLTFTNVFDNEDNPIRAIGILQDITREKNAELQYQREMRYLEISDSQGVLFYEADITSKKFLSGHEIFMQTYCDEISEDFNVVIELLFSHKVYEDDKNMVRSYVNLEKLEKDYYEGKVKTVFEYRRIINNLPIWSECTIKCFTDIETNHLHCIGCIKNIDENKKKELDLKKKSEIDLLTGLYNKVTSELLIKEIIIHNQKEDNYKGAFFILDIDNFKKVNDTLGHAFGDSVISKVGYCLASQFREKDVVGRLGGDEFVVFMHSVIEEELVVNKAIQISNILKELVVFENNTYRISISIGISLYPDNGNSFDELYKNADKALYEVKKKGKDHYVVFKE